MQKHVQLGYIFTRCVVDVWMFTMLEMIMEEKKW